MKVITWFHSNSELIARVIKEEVNVSEESSEDECDEDEDEDEDSDYEVQDDQVIFIRLIRLISLLGNDKGKFDVKLIIKETLNFSSSFQIVKKPIPFMYVWMHYLH